MASLRHRTQVLIPSGYKNTHLTYGEAKIFLILYEFNILRPVSALKSRIQIILNTKLLMMSEVGLCITQLRVVSGIIGEPNPKLPVRSWGVSAGNRPGKVYR